MSKLSIKRIIPAAAAGLLLMTPLSAWADVSPDAQSAASAGVQYLANNQNSDGSISGFGGESEWSVEAVEAAGQDPATFAHNGSASLLDFVETDVPAPGTPITALERNIIAIAAAGQDPASFGGVNYEALLEAQHTGGQIGDPTLLNDDIFGIIAIDAAHAGALQSEAQDGLDYLLANQGADGGFSYNTTPGTGSDNNDTAAAIIAMYAAQDLGLTAANLSTAESNALTYLLGTQQADGGFAYDNFSPSDGDSTAWSLMALNAIGSSVAAQAASARGWLLADQNADGGFSYGAFGVTTSDTYTTANVVTALLGSTWLLRPAPVSPTGGSGAAQASAAATTTTVSPLPPASQAGTVPPATATTTTTSSSTVSTPAPANNTAPAGPQVMADTTDKPNTQAAKPAAATKKTYSQAIYGAAILILVALGWFMLESRKAGKAK